MATTLTLDVIQYFPVGTTLNAYAFNSENPDGVTPPVAATATAAVAAAGTVTFTGLADGTRYWVGTGTDPFRYLSATTAGAGTTLTAMYRNYVPHIAGQLASGSLAGTYLLTPGLITAGPEAVTAAGSTKSGNAPFYLKASELPAVAGLAPKMRLRAGVINNATAPAINFVFGLRAVATYGGAASAAPTVATVGASDVTGSSVTFTSPAAAGAATADSADFTPPADGWYVLTCTTSGTLPATCISSLHAQVDLRYA